MDSETSSRVYRAPMRARDRDAPRGAGAAHAVANGLVGTGDALAPAPRTLEEAVAAATETHGAKAGRMLHAFAHVSDGALAWTQGSDGSYWLGRIAGPWSYDDSPAARAVGIHHVRPAVWLERGFDEARTPAGVVATFARGGRNFQRVHGDDVEAASARLWAEAGASPPDVANA